MIYLTKPQRRSLHRVWLRTCERGYLGTVPYREFRRGVQPGPGCVMINFAGMWLGIETDGYTHS
jgi:hypothetical protein